MEYTRAGILDINFVLAAIHESIDSKNSKELKYCRERRDLGGHMVKTVSLRLRTFALKGIVCKKCGIEGKFFAVERDVNDRNPNGPYHLNLWAVNEAGEEVIMTHDHILSRGNGGVDNLSNTQTMCGPCNWEKGIHENKYTATKKDIKLAILELDIAHKSVATNTFGGKRGTNGP